MTELLTPAELKTTVKAPRPFFIEARELLILAGPVVVTQLT